MQPSPLKRLHNQTGFRADSTNLLLKILFVVDGILQQLCNSNRNGIAFIIRPIVLLSNVLFLCGGNFVLRCFSVASEQLFDRRRCELFKDGMPLVPQNHVGHTDNLVQRLCFLRESVKTLLTNEDIGCGNQFLQHVCNLRQDFTMATFPAVAVDVTELHNGSPAVIAVNQRESRTAE